MVYCYWVERGWMWIEEKKGNAGRSHLGINVTYKLLGVEVGGYGLGWN